MQCNHTHQGSRRFIPVWRSSVGIRVQTSISGWKILRQHHRTVAGMTILRQSGFHGSSLVQHDGAHWNRIHGLSLFGSPWSTHESMNGLPEMPWTPVQTIWLSVRPSRCYKRVPESGSTKVEGWDIGINLWPNLGKPFQITHQAKSN